MSAKDTESNNKEPRDFIQLAERFSSQGQIEKAIEICQEGKNLYPDYISIQLLLGRFLYQVKRYPQSKKIIESILEKTPDYAPAYKILGDIFIEEKNWKAAKEILHKALFLDPWDKTTEGKLEYIEKIGTEKGVKEGNVFLTATMAELYVNQGMVLEAVRIYYKLHKSKKNKKYLERAKELESSPLYKKNVLENQNLSLNTWLKAVDNLKKK
ncbi:MAG: tetratricopeptide repeat protein [Candidatus Aminicenantia bacterium]